MSRQLGGEITFNWAVEGRIATLHVNTDSLGR